MGPVAIVEDNIAEGLCAPPLPTVWRGHPFALEDAFDGAYREFLCADHFEDAPHDRHSPFVYQVTVPALVEAKSECGCPTRDYLPLFGLPEFAPPGSLCRLRSLILRQLIQNAVRELALRALDPPIV